MVWKQAALLWPQRWRRKKPPPLTSSKSLQCTDTEVETAWPSKAELNMRERSGTKNGGENPQLHRNAAATTLL